MDDNEKESLQYRFSDYQLPKIILDETGHSYIVLNPHPYYYNQPMYWAGGCNVLWTPKAAASPVPPDIQNALTHQGHVYRPLPLDKDIFE